MGYRQVFSASSGLLAVEVVVLTIIFSISYAFLNAYTPESVVLVGNGVLLQHLFLFVLPINLSLLGLGLYNHKIRENFRGVLRRITLGVSLAYFIASVVYVLTPLDVLPLNFREWLYAWVMICLSFTRYVAYKIEYSRLGRRRVLVLGTGIRAGVIEKRMRRRVDRADFDIIACVPIKNDAPDCLHNEPIIEMPAELEVYVAKNSIDEIVIAADDRRASLPLEQIFMCKLKGIQVTDIVEFIERECGQIDISLVHWSWLIASNGFSSRNYLRDSLDWIFNASLALIVFLLTWPLMIATIIAIKIEDGITAKVIYSQERIGVDGASFLIFKFRSMRIDAEKDGAKFAEIADPRITNIGNFIRKYRLDELPQLFNVFRGEMGFVGPRPERPNFVNEYIETIPYYRHRHNVKPGLTGWAQLKYPYGGSYNDSVEKLKYDLYYIKHRSFMFDLLILIRTAEIVIFGQGR
ncbi:TIGR03013 family PEP-CTERM/XrtA system glycosyltransferase [Alginatibacterium sediminis]|uniref:TIGR03013 family PEP-CTERM/XrtA system glycosyltransferase n=1 Tax=Alginatibacterium sediminis TaxID=2164068 RepID=A0A420E7I2_9ALTE|nr:TIGR03013 family XrtA/PEP-CTERM system glycosyltransferase [Alginatibacterium sediminis]RKF14398.1 TIGR03013 family PEP-CTERM/XrtA system glycosyltransferase [Alginatibacterium sediminis]